ncbi:hypothetical protein [Aliihoeflea sp. 2WW]|uniref:hypothetical protein n=1 Tax=Aliihoeflea sp. 2WW TaxID=1381123 RepID=UPI0004BCA16A|nr:hypothetical protein [Aliihoeflea sp. 2WW]
MNANEESVETIIQMALAHGLVDDIMEEITAQADIIDLVNRLLLADAIDIDQAVRFIQLLSRE